jgi:hypothetical protein
MERVTREIVGSVRSSYEKMSKIDCLSQIIVTIIYSVM